MAKQSANINPDLLIWARRTIKLPLTLAADKIGVKEEILENWEKGEAVPTIKQLYKIAETYKRPFALFYFPEPPKHFKPLKDFRKFPDNYIVSEKEEYQLEKELLSFQRKREQALELYDLLEEKVPEFTIKANSDEQPQVVAQRIIGSLKINHREIAALSPGYDALNYWKSFLESKGILIFQSSGIPLEVMRGACIAKTKLPIIIINSNDSPNGRIFSLFHELVHVVLREEGITNFRYSNREEFDPVEIFCNRVAAEILVPSELILSNYIVGAHQDGETWSNEEINGLSSHFCVSPEVIYRRLLTLEKVDLDSYLRFREEQNQIVRQKQKSGDYYRNVVAKNGRLFLNLALQSYYQDKINASSLYDYIQVKLSNLVKLEDKLYAKL